MPVASDNEDTYIDITGKSGKSSAASSHDDEDTYIDITGKFGKSSSKVVTKAPSVVDRKSPLDSVYSFLAFLSPKPSVPASTKVTVKPKPIAPPKSESKSAKAVEAEKAAKAKAEAEKAAKAKAENDRLVKAEADRLVKAAAEAEKAAKAKAAAEAEKAAKAKAEAEKAAKAKAENDRLVKAEADRLAKAEKAAKSKAADSSAKKVSTLPVASDDEDTYIDLTDRFGNFFADSKPISTSKVNEKSKGLKPLFTLPNFNSGAKSPSPIAVTDRKGLLKSILDLFNRKSDNVVRPTASSPIIQVKDRLLNDLVNIGFGGLAVYIIMSRKVANALAPKEKSPEIVVKKETEFVYIFSEVGKDFFMNSIIYALFVYFTLVMVFSLSPTFWLTYVPTAAEIQNKVASYAYI